MAKAPVFYLSIKQIQEATTICPRLWRDLVARNEAPAPRQLSGKRTAWLAREVEEWAETRPVATALPPPNTGWRRNKSSDGRAE